jgi:hypothetical protein
MCSKLQLGLVHRTVRWCTGQCPVRQAGPRELAALGNKRRRTAIIHRTVRWCTGPSGEPTAASANGRPAIFARHVVAPTVGWAHRTVSGAPTDPEDQRSAALHMERNQAPYMNSSCPVVHRAVRCTTRQKARLAFQVGLQRLLAALGL